MTLAQIEAMARIGLDDTDVKLSVHTDESGTILVATETITRDHSLHIANSCPTGVAAELIDQFCAAAKNSAG